MRKCLDIVNDLTPGVDSYFYSVPEDLFQSDRGPANLAKIFCSLKFVKYLSCLHSLNVLYVCNLCLCVYTHTHTPKDTKIL